MKNATLIFIIFCFSLSTSLKAQWLSSGSNIYFNTGNVSIGTPNSTSSGLSIGTTQGVALSLGNPAWGTTRILQTGWENGNGDFTDLGVPGATANNVVLRLTAGGMLGVNTTTPNTEGGISVNATHGVQLSIGNPNWARKRILLTGWDNVNGDFTDLYVPGATANSALLRMNATGAVLIGKQTSQNPAYKLDVAGSGRFNQVVVNSTGADFVFDSTYRLASLEEVERFIRTNHHLADIPAAHEIQKMVSTWAEPRCVNCRRSRS